MDVEVGKYYKMEKNGNIMVGKCLKATPKKCKFHVVFDEGKLEINRQGTHKWYVAGDFDEVTQISDNSTVLELLK